MLLSSLSPVQGMALPTVGNSSHFNNLSRLSPKGISMGSSLISQMMLTFLKLMININYHGV